MMVNLSFSKSDMRPPDIFYYLPHLINNPRALKPVVKLSQGRIGGKIYN